MATKRNREGRRARVPGVEDLNGRSISTSIIFPLFFAFLRAHGPITTATIYITTHGHHTSFSLILVALFCIPHFYHLSDSVILPLSLPTRTSPFLLTSHLVFFRVIGFHTWHSSTQQPSSKVNTRNVQSYFVKRIPSIRISVF